MLDQHPFRDRSAQMVQVADIFDPDSKLAGSGGTTVLVFSQKNN